MTDPGDAIPSSKRARDLVTSERPHAYGADWPAGPAGAPPSSPHVQREMPIDSRALPDDAYDVAIVGGGVNGTGLARDLALRGLRVVLFERNDFAFGASGNSSGMIHGGPRYLTSNPEVTEQSCKDSGFIQRIAPHLLFRVPFLMPIKAGPKGRIMLELIDAFFGLYDRYQPLKRGEKHTRLSPSELASLEPGLVGNIVGGVTFDEWGIDGARLCVLNAIDAIEHGATIHTHCAVEGAMRAPDDNGKRRYVLDAREAATAGCTTTQGRARRVLATCVVNATGAWSPVTAALCNLQNTRVRVRPGKGIHIVYERRLSNYAILAEAVDGRQIFLAPWQNVSVLGTTDDDYFGDLNDVVATSEEVRYLVQGVARVFPSIRAARAIGTYAGVRPTLYAFGKSEDSLSREHAIVDHAGDGAPGVYSMIGGKLASYRIFAQEMADRIARDLAPASQSTTHERPLPGGERVPEAIEFARVHELSPVGARRLVYRHGARAERIALRMREHAVERTVVCPCEPVFEAEVRHVVREEMARSIGDVARRTRLGLGACGGMRCAVRCGQIIAEELDLPPRVAVEQARDFLETQARARVAALGPAQAPQEALLLAHLTASLGLPPQSGGTNMAPPQSGGTNMAPPQSGGTNMAPPQSGGTKMREGT